MSIQAKHTPGPKHDHHYYDVAACGFATDIRALRDAFADVEMRASQLGQAARDIRALEDQRDALLAALTDGDGANYNDLAFALEGIAHELSGIDGVDTRDIDILEHAAESIRAAVARATGEETTP